MLLINGSTYLSLRELANIFNEEIDFKNKNIYIKGGLDDIIEKVTEENLEGEECKPEFTVINELILKPNGELWVYGDNEGGRLLPTIKDKHITQPVKLFDDVRQILESGYDRGKNFEDFPAYLIVKEDNTLWRLGLKQEKLMDDVAKINDDVIITIDGELYLHGFKGGLIVNEILSLLGSSNDEFLAWDTWDEPYKLETIKVKGISNVKDAMYVSATETNANGTGISNEAESLLILKNDNSLWGCTKYTTTIPGKVKGQLNSIDHIMGDVKSLVNAGNVNAVIKNDNSLWAWGETSYGAFGGGLEESIEDPKKIMDDVRCAYIESDKCLVVTNNNELYTWGSNQFDTYNESKSVNRYKLASNIQKISRAPFHFAAVKTDGTVWMYGRDQLAEIEEYYDEEGNYIEKDKDSIGSFGTANVRKNIGYYKFHSAEPMRGAVDIQVNSYPNIRTYALKADGSVWVWGDKFIIVKNEDIELGKGTNTRIPRPFIR